MNDDIVTTDATGDEGPSDASRREFLKRSAVAGAVVWSAPAIASLPGGRAWAADYDQCPECPNCDAQATAVNILNTVVLGRVDTGCDCTIGPIDQTVLTVNVKASVACAQADDAACSARTYLENVEILLGSVPLLGNVYLKAQTLSSCVSCGTGDSYVANLAVHVGGSAEPLVLSANCNGTPVLVTVSGIDLAEVVFNEQICDNGTLTVNALRVTILGTGDVIVGQAKAGASGCTCEPCSTNPTCQAPRSTLC